MHLLSLASLVALTWNGPTSRGLDVPYVPTPYDVVEVMLEMAKVTRADTLYDLGSGDGRVVVTAARKYGARGLGVDLDPERITEARANARRRGVTERVEFRQADLFRLDLRKASVVTMYLLPDVNLKLRPRIIEQLRPGARVVSHNYHLGDWLPDATRNISDGHVVYMWTVPAQVAGHWQWMLPLPSGPQGYQMQVDQHFQQVRGTLTATGIADARPPAGGGADPTLANNFRDATDRSSSTQRPAANGNRPVFRVVDPKLVGDLLTFTVTNSATPAAGPPAVTMQYRGTISRDAVVGSVTITEGTTVTELPWNAARPAAAATPPPAAAGEGAAAAATGAR